MRTAKQIKAKIEKKNAKRKAYEAHRNRNPKDNKFYREYKKKQGEVISKFQAESERRAKEDKKFFNRVKNFGRNVVARILPNKTNRGA